MALFPQKKLKLVISDFHMGKGKRLPDGSQNLLEDFQADRQFIDFLDYFSSGPYRKSNIELIINGDFFNFLQVDYRDEFTDFITEGDSLHKLMKIVHGHEDLFNKLGEFSRESNHEVTFILGNHDPGLLWPGVQEALKEILKGSVNFEMGPYTFDQVHIEHGNQYLSDNCYDPEEYFLAEDLPEPIIHLPFGSFLVIHYLNQIKKERPYLDKVYPFGLYLRWALFHDTRFAIKSMFRLVFWFFKFILKRNPAVKIGWRQVMGILGETTVHPKLHREALKLFEKQKNLRIVIFGHTHQHQHMRFAPNQDYFNTGTWNEKISLDVGSLGRLLRLTFVQIDYDKEGYPQGSLKEWKGRTDVIEEVTF